MVEHDVPIRRQSLEMARFKQAVFEDEKDSPPSGSPLVMQ